MPEGSCPPRWRHNCEDYRTTLGASLGPLRSSRGGGASCGRVDRRGIAVKPLGSQWLPGPVANSFTEQQLSGCSVLKFAVHGSSSGADGQDLGAAGTAGKLVRYLEHCDPPSGRVSHAPRRMALAGIRDSFLVAWAAAAFSFFVWRFRFVVLRWCPPLALFSPLRNSRHGQVKLSVFFIDRSMERGGLGDRGVSAATDEGSC